MQRYEKWCKSFDLLIVLLFFQGKDLQELRRFIYSNSLDRHVLRKLLRKIVPPKCKCPEGSCVGHEVAVVIESTVNELDLPEENIATLLCHLESHPAKWVLEVFTVYIFSIIDHNSTLRW